ncbi:8475_t:CDS:2, partial [Racocetra fulgida]
NLVAINRYTAIQIEANGINEALNKPENAIVKLRAVEVVPGIHFGQAIWWLKTHFSIVEEELQDIMYRTIRK